MTQISLLLTSKRAPRVISQSFKTPSEKLGTFLPLLTAASESVGLPAAFATNIQYIFQYLDSGSPISNINTKRVSKQSFGTSSLICRVWRSGAGGGALTVVLETRGGLLLGEYWGGCSSAGGRTVLDVGVGHLSVSIFYMDTLYMWSPSRRSRLNLKQRVIPHPSVGGGTRLFTLLLVSSKSNHRIGCSLAGSCVHAGTW